MKKRLLIGGVAAGAVALALAVWAASRYAELYVVNGLPFPVEVSLGGERVVVKPEAWVRVASVPKGAHGLVARREDGREVERLPVQLEWGFGNVYNVLGAAPLAVDTIWYASKAAADVPPATTWLCGTSFSRVDADYTFVAPPDSVSLAKGKTSESRRVLRLDPGGFGACVERLRGQPAQASDFVAGLAEAMPDAPQLPWVAATFAAQAKNPARALELVDPLVAKTDSVENHRQYQALLTSMGQRAELVKRYRARWEKSGRAADAYLLARLLAPADALPVLEAAVAKAPDDADLRRSLAWQHDVLADWPRVLADAEWYRAHAPKGDAYRPVWLEFRTRALVGLGRAREALDFLEGELPTDASWDFGQAILVHRTARAAGRPPKASPFKQLERVDASGRDEALFRYFYELHAGLDAARPTELRAGQGGGFDVLAHARDNPAAALRSLRALPVEAPTHLQAETAYLLLGEAFRLKDEAAAARLAAVDFWGGDVGALRRFVLDGGEEGALGDLNGTERASMLLARGRVLEAGGDKKRADALYGAVRAADPLGGLAVQALGRWPAPVAAAVAGAVPEVRLERREGVVLTPRGP